MFCSRFCIGSGGASHGEISRGESVLVEQYCIHNKTSLITRHASDPGQTCLIRQVGPSSATCATAEPLPRWLRWLDRDGPASPSVCFGARRSAHKIRDYLSFCNQLLQHIILSGRIMIAFHESSATLLRHPNVDDSTESKVYNVYWAAVRTVWFSELPQVTASTTARPRIEYSQADASLPAEQQMLKLGWIRHDTGITGRCCLCVRQSIFMTCP